MEKFAINYSTKNIPIPTRSDYKLKLSEQTGIFLKAMRWSAFFFLNGDKRKRKKETFGFRTTRLPETITLLRPFEEELLQIIEQLEFRQTYSTFQTKLTDDLKAIQSSKNVLVPADKTTNYYSVPKEQYTRLLKENVTKEYKKAAEDSEQLTNMKMKQITDQLDLSDRVDVLAPKAAFVTMKDHKRNFRESPTCRLINPSKLEIDIISKTILDRINAELLEATKVNQWKSTKDVIHWFKDVKTQSNTTFLTFDIVSFYPSISKELLQEALTFAKQYATISQLDQDIILQAKSNLLFNEELPWQKKNTQDPFDVTMGSADGAESCELVGTYLLNKISSILPKHQVGLYRDDGLAVVHLNPRDSENLKKDLCALFEKYGLKITADTNTGTVDFLDVTLNIRTKAYKPFTKPGNRQLYVNRSSNHPPSVIKHIPKSIQSRLSTISSNESVFDNSKGIYEKALHEAGHSVNLKYQPNPPNNNNQQKSRKRHIIWYNPPYSINVKTNIGKLFLNLVTKHFPKGHPLNKIFNRNTLKISYCCMPNMATIIKRHNSRILKANTDKPNPTCNCRGENNKRNCPLPGRCTIESVVYEAKVATDVETKTYIGLTSNSFKSRYTKHKASFNRRTYNQTALSKYIWKLKDAGTPYTLTWSIKKQAPSYSPKSKKCPLCMWEKFYICEADRLTRLNRRSELVSSCIHRKRFLLSENG